MSFLSLLKSYWVGNATLTAALPVSSVFLGVVPESQPFPYAVLTSVSNTPTYTTCNSYLSDFLFDLNIYDTDPDNVESLANTIAGAIDQQPIDASTAGIYRINGPMTLVDTVTPQRVYHSVVSFRWTGNRVLPAT